MKLNNVFKILSMSCLLLGATSCEDFLTNDHPTATTDDKFWKTMNECESALAQCKSWPCGAYYEGLSIMSMEGMTDNMYSTANFEQRIVMMGNGSMVPPTNANAPTSWEGTFDTWQNYYLLIRRCCRFLEHVDAAYFSDESERTRMKVEAKVWRAWYHMLLLKWYGRHDGIPVVNKALNPEEIYMARSTVEECLQFINQEFDEVLQIQDDKAFPFLWDEGRRDRMSKAVVLAMKMDINLQFKEYDAAKNAAEQLINSDIFELYHDTDAEGENTSYRNLFTYVGEQNKERIFFTEDGNSCAWFRNMSSILSGQGCISPLKSLVDTYETIDGKTIQSLPEEERLAYEKDPLYRGRDPRLNATIFCPGDNSTIYNYTYLPFDPNGSDYVGTVGTSRSGYLLKKYIDENDRTVGWGGGSLDFVIYRYAEVLLDYVECLVESGDWQNPKVELYINMIRNRAGLPDMDKSVYNSQEKVRELYRRERRVELCFEGKRYDDIRRWGIGPETMTGPAEGAWNPNENSFVLIETRNCTFPKYDSWPIPQQEEIINPNISQPLGW